MAHPSKSHAQKSRQEVPHGATAKPVEGSAAEEATESPAQEAVEDRAPTQAPRSLPAHPHRRPPR